MGTVTQKKFDVDLLHGPILRAMLIFAVPLFFSGVFQQFYNTMDTVIIGHTLGDEALAAMGAAGAIYDLLIGFALGIGNGLAIVTARSFGSGDATYFILYPFLGILNTPAEIIEQAYAYISTITMFIGVMSSMLNIVLDLFFITQVDFGVVKPLSVRSAEYWKQDTAHRFQRYRADR